MWIRPPFKSTMAFSLLSCILLPFYLYTHSFSTLMAFSVVLLPPPPKKNNQQYTLCIYFSGWASSEGVGVGGRVEVKKDSRCRGKWLTLHARVWPVFVSKRSFHFSSLHYSYSVSDSKGHHRNTEYIPTHTRERERERARERERESAKERERETGKCSNKVTVGRWAALQHTDFFSHGSSTGSS